MLDRDLAVLYGVETRALNQAVMRNKERFPTDFMFRLFEAEARFLVSRNVIPHKKYLGGHLPYAFTEHGVAMLSSVLKSPRAIQANIRIMRALAKLRQIVSSNKGLALKVEDLERKFKGHDAQIKNIFDAIRGLMAPPEKPRPRIGFQP